MAKVRIMRAMDVRQYDTYVIDTDELSEEQLEAVEELIDAGSIDENEDGHDELREILLGYIPVDTDHDEVPDSDNMSFIPLD